MSTFLDVAPIEHLDFEFETPCDVIGCTPNTAAFFVTFRCCGHQMFWCESCMQIVHEHLAWGGLFYCDVCEASNIDNPFLLVERL